MQGKHGVLMAISMPQVPGTIRIQIQGLFMCDANTTVLLVPWPAGVYVPQV